MPTSVIKSLLFTGFGLFFFFSPFSLTSFEVSGGLGGGGEGRGYFLSGGNVVHGQGKKKKSTRS